MLSAEDYIEMRRNGYRGKWLTYSIFLALLSVGSVFLLLHSIAVDDGVLVSFFLLLLTSSLTISGFVSAYRKEPFVLGSGHDGTTGFGGGLDGD